MDTFDVAVVGAGHNGLACAALLAKRGYKVAVFEQSQHIGGTAVSLTDEWPGYTISAASYVCSLLDPWLVEELNLCDYGYDAYRKDPASFTPLEDGRSLLLGSDSQSNAREIAAFNRNDVEGFERFDQRATELGSLLFESFSDEHPDFNRFAADVRADLEGSAASLVERYVTTPVLQAGLATDGLIGTYAGPRNTGTGYVLAHHYAGRALGVQGAWGFVRGGMGAITRALAASARSFGAEIISNAGVQAFRADDNRVTGVVLHDGREFAARCVASNAHPETTFSTLASHLQLPQAVVSRLKNWRSVGPSLKLNLALGELPNFTARPGTTMQPHHRATIHIAPTIDFLQKAYTDAIQTGESDQPMLECFMQTPTDASLAPKGKHILSIFAQYFPFDRARGWNHDDREAAADKIVAMLAKYAPNIPNAIEARQVLAPPDLYEKFGLVGGHIFHGELLPGQIYEDRFDVRTGIEGLYLCGSGTHPGGCVSGFPGKRAAAAIAADLVLVK